MPNSKVASLSSALLARKGAARPASWSEIDPKTTWAEPGPAPDEDVGEPSEEESGEAHRGEAHLQATHVKRGRLSVIEGDKARDERIAADRPAKPDTEAKIASRTSEPLVKPARDMPRATQRTTARGGPSLTTGRARPAPAARPSRPRKGRWMLVGLGVLVVAGIAAGYVGGDTDTPLVSNTAQPAAKAATASNAPLATEPPPATPIEMAPAVTAEPPASATETPEIAPAPAAPENTAPSVDVIRVKSDGSAVLAGRGPADTDWIVMHNDTPLGVVTINRFGEWVYLPTQALPPGAHEFSLVRKNPESKVVLPSAQKSDAESTPDVPLQSKPIGPDASIDEPAERAPTPMPRPRETLS